DVQPAPVGNKPVLDRGPATVPAARPTNVVVAQPARPTVTNTAPTFQPDIAETPGTRPVRDVLEAQIALASLGISCGPLDGVLGSQTRAALRAYQRSAGLPITGMIDAQTRRTLTVKTPVFTNYIVTREDVARLLPVSPTWVGKSQQLRMDYATLLELIAEKTRSHPGLVRRLNNGVDWAALGPGTAVTVVALEEPHVKAQAASVRISLVDKTLEAFDAEGNLVAHFPCSIARAVEKRPVGQLRVVTVVRNPNYTFNPQLFPESAEARRLTQKLIIPPGPNNPVGTAWIGLDRPGYGIHGTPNPEQVGRTESHGCFRLANWDAEFLAGLVRVGMPVYVE
ncbi:MAG TPA: L,D-transpeptidase family protein, partial [Verrucomicrobiota bacterium]|nr:L,D-transpeptidase family protein [Verrucomicrobiota bacterium]